MRWLIPCFIIINEDSLRSLLLLQYKKLWERVYKSMFMLNWEKGKSVQRYMRTLVVSVFGLGYMSLHNMFIVLLGGGGAIIFLSLQHSYFLSLGPERLDVWL